MGYFYLISYKQLSTGTLLILIKAKYFHLDFQPKDKHRDKLYMKP